MLNPSAFSLREKPHRDTCAGNHEPDGLVFTTDVVLHCLNLLIQSSPPSLMHVGGAMPCCVLPRCRNRPDETNEITPHQTLSDEEEQVRLAVAI
jgi:hypothetical protein